MKPQLNRSIVPINHRETALEKISPDREFGFNVDLHQRGSEICDLVRFSLWADPSLQANFGVLRLTYVHMLSRSPRLANIASRIKNSVEDILKI